MVKKIVFSFTFLVLLLIVSANDDRCKNKPNGFECGVNRFCFDSKCEHKTLFPINLKDILMAASLIFGSITSVICGIGGNFNFSFLFLTDF
jgi:hypothetical protein